MSDYNFRNYVGYAIYAPLYIAGPILTFNDYISQSKYRPRTIETPRTIRYAVRLVLVLLAMEFILHHVYVGAISHALPVWSSYTASQLALLSYFNLHIIWLKLLLPWRLFRLWSLVDGVDPPENMVRCVSNNFSTQHFWRAWHRSYNKWLIRYIYIPLGGARFEGVAGAVRSLGTYVMVFTFVALWHDIKLRLLIWGWLVVLFLLPEVVAKKLFPASRWRDSPVAYRMLCGVGSLGNVFMMMSANLVGFAVGLEGMKSILEGIFKDFHGGFPFVTFRLHPFPFIFRFLRLCLLSDWANHVLANDAWLQASYSSPSPARPSSWARRSCLRCASRRRGRGTTSTANPVACYFSFLNLLRFRTGDLIYAIYRATSRITRHTRTLQCRQEKFSA